MPRVEVTKGEAPKGGVGPARAASKVTIEVTAPLANNRGVQSAVEGAGALILSMQLSALRQAELDKAVAALKRLDPKIEKERWAGNDVTVTVAAEVPNTVNLADYLVGIGDVSQVVYFHDMYISSSMKHRDPDKPRQPNSMYPAGDSDYSRPPWWRDTPREGFHFDKRDLFLPAYPEGAREQFGTFHTVDLTDTYSSYVETEGLHRQLTLDTAGNITMHDDDSKEAWESKVPSPVFGDPIRARFHRTSQPRYSLDSLFYYKRLNVNGKSVPGLIEATRCTGSSNAPDHTWANLFYWVQQEGP
jgi:hypothetical protein